MSYSVPFNLHSLFFLFLFQEVNHFKQMRGNEAGAAEIKTQGESWEWAASNLNATGRSYQNGWRHAGGLHAMKSAL